MNPEPLAAPVVTAPDGPRLSRLVQGYWRMDAWDRGVDEHLAFLQAHVDLGITTVDHADLYGDYGNEERFGRVLARAPGLRERLQIVSKCGIQLPSETAPGRRVKHYDATARHITASVEHSLRKLGTDHLDLLLLHRPDPLMDAGETAAALVALRQAGKLRHVGVSNFTPAQFELLQSRLPFALATNQLEIGPLATGPLFDGALDQVQRLGIRPMAWSVLGGGRLFDASNTRGKRVRTALENVGERLGGWSADQVAFAWVLRLPSAPLPILGTGNIARVRAAVAAVNLPLDRESWFEILEAARGEPVP